MDTEPMILYSRWNCRHYTMRASAVRGSYKKRMRKVAVRPGWLENRVTLFSTFTYPSVLSQTNQDFRWIGIVDRESPAWFLEELKQFERMEIRSVEFDTDAAVRGETSINLDTDDAIARTFIERMSAIEFEGETIFSHGLKYRIDPEYWFHFTWDLAHFNMIQHPTMTVLDHLHGRFPLDKKVIGVEDPMQPMWLQVLHGVNIANRLNVPRSKEKGHPASLSRSYAKEHFDINYDDLSTDLLWRSPV